MEMHRMLHADWVLSTCWNPPLPVSKQQYVLLPWTRKNPELPSVSDIWKAADFNEREVYDFYGIVFIGHPDMRRLYLRNDWVGYPMRKDNDPEKDNPLRMDNEKLSIPLSS